MRTNPIGPGWAVLLAVAGAALLGAAAPFWWAGAACLVTAAYLLRARYGRIELRGLVAELLCIAALGVVAGYLIHPSWLGDRPIGWDHTVHYFKAWQLRESFLPGGRLLGWSNAMFAGYPVSYLYPFLADLFPTVVQLLSFEALRFGQAYSLSFALCFFAMGYGVYYFGRRCFNRPVGLAAALFYFTDGGGAHIGGWHWVVLGGVWMSSLAASVLLIALAHLRPLLTGRKAIDLAIFSLATGVALLLHPLALVGVITLIPLGVVACFACLEQLDPRQALKRLAAGLFLAGLVAALWYLPFLSVREYARNLGHAAGSIQEIAGGFVDLSFFQALSPYVGVLGLVGAVYLLLGRKPDRFYTGLCVFALLLFASDTFREVFRLDALVEGLRYVDYRRIPVLFKPFYFLSAAYLLCSIFTRFPDRGEAEPTPPASGISWRACVRVFLAAFVLAPFALPFAARAVETSTNRIYQRESSRFLKREMEGLIAWAEGSIARESEFFRLGINMTDKRNMLHDLPERLHLPQYKFNGTPATHFVYKPTSSDPELLRALSVKYVISDTPLPPESYEPVIRFGRLLVYRFRDWSPARYAVLDGAGEIRVVQFEDEEIVLEAGPGSSGTLRIHVSYFPRWKATLDGSPIEIRPVGIEEIEGVGFMSVELRPGTYRFVFRRSWVDHLGLLLCVVGMASIAFLFFRAIREARARPAES